LPPPVNVYVGRYNKMGRLQRRAVPLKTKLKVAQQSMLVYFPENPSE
jgi:hypothetical protein